MNVSTTRTYATDKEPFKIFRCREPFYYHTITTYYCQYIICMNINSITVDINKHQIKKPKDERR